MDLRKNPAGRLEFCEMLLIKNAEIYSPARIGKKDIFVCNEKIELIEDRIDGLPDSCRVIDAEGLMLSPGMIDQHIHVTGGGGEGSFHNCQFMFRICFKQARASHSRRPALHLPLFI